MPEVESHRSAALTMLRGSEPGPAPQIRPVDHRDGPPRASVARDNSDDIPTQAPVRGAPGFSDSPGFTPLPVVPPPTRDLSGTLLLDRYRLLKKLGEGGMGTVYLAEHVTIKKRCAIKLLNPEFAHKEDLVERFLQEARAASMIAHENVVEITDFGAAPNGSVFFVMEMLVGEDLADTIKREAPLPWSRVAPIALQICRALGAAHAKGIVHRDMKPENCFRIERSGNRDFIKVLDFGIAKVTSDDPDGTQGRLTSTGMIFGTPTYMSPEQAQGQKVDLRSDIYALGVILYELLTGKVPFSADNFMGILTKHMFDDPLRPSEAAPEAGISEEVEALVLKALQKDRGYRFQSMQELADAILDVGTGAEPVAVVVESRARPNSEGRPTAFLSRSISAPGVRASQEVTLTEPPPPIAPRRRGLVVALVAAIAVLGGGTAAMLAMSDDPVAPAPVVPVATAPVLPAVAPPVTPSPTAAPLPTPETPAVADPRVYVVSNVPAEVVVAADGRPLGATGDGGFTIPRGEAPLAVLVRASGYEDLPLALEPTAERRFEAQLKPKKKTVAGKGKDPKVAVKPTDPKPDAAVPDPKPADPKTKGSMGLKNPFEVRGP